MILVDLTKLSDNVLLILQQEARQFNDWITHNRIDQELYRRYDERLGKLRPNGDANHTVLIPVLGEAT